jgi:hypothetical protein
MAPGDVVHLVHQAEPDAGSDGKRGASFYERTRQFKLIIPRSLSAEDKRILDIAFEFAHGDGRGIWAGVKTFANIAGVTERSAAGSLKRLGEQHFLEDDGWHKTGGQTATRRRAINFDALREKRREEDASPPRRRKVGGRLKRGRGGEKSAMEVLRRNAVPGDADLLRSDAEATLPPSASKRRTTFCVQTQTNRENLNREKKEEPRGTRAAVRDAPSNDHDLFVESSEEGSQSKAATNRLNLALELSGDPAPSPSEPSSPPAAPTPIPAPAATAPEPKPEARLAPLCPEAMQLIERLTGKTAGAARAFGGKLLKLAGDPATVLAIVRHAVELRPIDVTSWLIAAARYRGDKVKEAAERPSLVADDPVLQMAMQCLDELEQQERGLILYADDGQATEAPAAEWQPPPMPPPRALQPQPDPTDDNGPGVEWSRTVAALVPFATTRRTP